MAAWLTGVLERNESLRFEALGLLDQARAKLQEAEAPEASSGPGKDASLAALTVLHMATKSLLAARGIRSLSARLSLILLRVYYPESVTESLLTRCAKVQGFTVQGPEALAVAREFLEQTEKILTKSG